MQNTNYNLVNILTYKLHRVWHRYDQYIEDAMREGCASCKELWEKIKQDEQKHIEWIRKEIEKHVNERRFN